jgi:Zn-dependent peptidase ImmA (M78 family)
MNINKIIQKLIRKFNTNDPFQLADLLGVLTILKPLGKIKGCYKLIKKRKVIFINSMLDYFERRVVCAHELGHAIMHPTTNCKYLQNYTLLSVKKIEIEANRFCVFLLLPDDALAEYDGLTYEEISKLTYIPAPIIKLRQTQVTLI